MIPLSESAVHLKETQDDEAKPIIDFLTIGM